MNPKDPATGQFTSPSKTEALPAAPAAPATEPAASPTPPPVAEKTSPYDLGDTSYDPDLDGYEPLIEKKEEKVETPAPEPAKPPAPPAPKHTARLSRLATALGFTQAEIDASTPDELRNEMQAAMIEQEMTRRAKPAESTPPKQEAEAEIDFGEFEPHFDPETAKALKGILKQTLSARDKAHAEKLQAMEQKVQFFEQVEQRRQAEAVTQQIDHTISALGADFEPVFGKGSYRDRSPEQLARVNRAIDEAVRQAGQGASFQQQLAAFSQAAQTLFGFAVKPSAPVKGRITEEQWKEAGVAKPTDRQRAEPEGKEKAVRTAAAWLKANGFDDDAETTNGKFFK